MVLVPNGMISNVLVRALLVATIMDGKEEILHVIVVTTDITRNGCYGCTMKMYHSNLHLVRNTKLEPLHIVQVWQQ